MTKARYFGTDGIRGVANVDLLSPERVLALGRALGRLAKRRGGCVALARDPRRSSPMIAGALSAGIASEGSRVVDLGILPTPGLAALLPAVGAGLGAMVSASHNPMADNGIKVLSIDGGKLADADEVWLEAEMEAPPGAAVSTGAAVGAIDLFAGAEDAYVDYIRGRVRGLSLDGLRIVLDAANGATSRVGPRIFEALGAEVIAIHASPDGLNINERCGAVHPEAMAAAVVAHGADAGVAFDGDGDRAILAGADGRILDGDHVLYACARHFHAAGRLEGGVVVGTVMTNYGLELALRDFGAYLERTPVGDRYIAQALREHGWSLGGEPSGHVIFGADNAFIGDGVYTALRALETARAANRPIHEVAGDLVRVPQELVNVPVREKPSLDTIPSVRDSIEAAESELNGTGRVLVRYSGTENLCRVMVEGTDAVQVGRIVLAVAAVIRGEIGADPVPS